MAAESRSRRAWGWHPLTPTWARKIVTDADVRPADLVFDIGAGEGALTSYLLGAGARVVAVESHPGRARHLRERFDGAPVTIVEADALTLRPPRRPFKVVASPPYTISSALLRMLLSKGSGLTSADLVLQRQVVRRFVDSQPATRRRSFPWTMSVGRPLPRTAFRPPPHVDSAVLVIRRR